MRIGKKPHPSPRDAFCSNANATAAGVNLNVLRESSTLAMQAEKIMTYSHRRVHSTEVWSCRMADGSVRGSCKI